LGFHRLKSRQYKRFGVEKKGCGKHPVGAFQNPVTFVQQVPTTLPAFQICKKLQKSRQGTLPPVLFQDRKAGGRYRLKKDLKKYRGIKK
jgi:hypothetical protein